MQLTLHSILIEAADVLPRSSELLLIDAREPEAYRRGHLPGAVNLPAASMEWSVKLSGGGEVHHLLAPAERISPMLSFLGINRDAPVVLYDEGSGYKAARVFWILDYFSHSRLMIMNGGLAAWKSCGGIISGAAPRSQRGNFVPEANPRKIADFPTVCSAIGSADTVLLNSLPRSSFQNEAIPGSLNIPYTSTFRGSRSSRLLDPRQLEELFLGASISPQREVIVYCGIGYTASQLYFTFRLLSYPRVRLYDGSLADWKARGGALEPGR